MAKPRAIVLDVYGTILDPEPIASGLQGIVPRNDEVARLWRRKQIEYGVLASAAHHDTNFHRITLEALEYALAACNVSLDAEKKNELCELWGGLPAYPDAQAALSALSDEHPLLALTNGSERLTLQALEKAGLDVFFKWVRSADTAKRFKPSPEVYEIALHAVHSGRPEEFIYVSGNAWDVAGAGLFGFTTCRVLRTDEPAERFGMKPDFTVKSLSELPGRMREKLVA